MVITVLFKPFDGGDGGHGVWQVMIDDRSIDAVSFGFLQNVVQLEAE